MQSNFEYFQHGSDAIILNKPAPSIKPSQATEIATKLLPAANYFVAQMMQVRAAARTNVTKRFKPHGA